MLSGPPTFWLISAGRLTYIPFFLSFSSFSLRLRITCVSKLTLDPLMLLHSSRDIHPSLERFGFKPG